MKGQILSKDLIIIEYKCFKSSKPLAYYAGGNYKVNKFSKFYFAFSISCLENALKNFGFEIIKKEKLKFFSKLKFPRHMVYAKRKTWIKKMILNLVGLLIN